MSPAQIHENQEATRLGWPLLRVAHTPSPRGKEYVLPRKCDQSRIIRNL